jgi:hypothetical protein
MVDINSFGRRVATQVANNALLKVAGNVKGLITGDNKGADSSDFYHVNKPQVDVKTFQFPLDVMGEPGLGNFGHYIMFYINEQDNATLTFGGAEAAANGNKALDKEIRTRRIPNYITRMKPDAKSGKSVSSKQKNDKLSNLIVAGDSSAIMRANKGMGATYEQSQTTVDTREPVGDQIISIERHATKRLDTCIALYMPQQINVTYGARYVETEITPLAAGAGDAIGQFVDNAIAAKGSNPVSKILSAVEASGGVKGLAQQTFARAGNEFERRLILGGLKAVDALGLTGLREAFEISRGEVITERMELAFKNVNRRPFTYNFKMIPKNKQEAEEIRKIIYAFKFNMLPEMKNRNSSIMHFPNTFDIEYHYAGKENDFISRVSTCVLENMSVSYGGDRFKTFPATSDGAPVVETSINLAFKELELITRERIEEGF